MTIGSKYTQHSTPKTSNPLLIMRAVFTKFIIGFLATNAIVCAQPTEKRQNDVPACVDGSGGGLGPYSG